MKWIIDKHQRKVNKMGKLVLVKNKGDTVFFLGGVFSAISRATLMACEDSKARGVTGAVAAGLHQSHSNTGSELRLQPTPQLTATLDP